MFVNEPQRKSRLSDWTLKVGKWEGELEVDGFQAELSQVRDRSKSFPLRLLPLPSSLSFSDNKHQKTINRLDHGQAVISLSEPTFSTKDHP